MTEEKELRLVDAYHAIGYIVATAAQIEFMAAQLLIRVGVDSKKAYKLKAGDLIKQFQARAEESDLAAGVASALEDHRAQQLFRQRNNLVHGRLLSVDQPEGFAMGRIHTDGETYTVFWRYDEYLKLANRFRGLNDALLDCLPHLRATPPAP